MVYTITVHLHANDDPASVEKLKAKLVEASRVYSRDKETLDWFVMQSTADPRSFTIVERYEKESVRSPPPPPPPPGSPCLYLDFFPLLTSVPARRVKNTTWRTRIGRHLTPTWCLCWTSPWT